MTIVSGTLLGIQWAIYFPAGAMIMLRDSGVETGLVIPAVINSMVDSFKVMTNAPVLLFMVWVDSRCLNQHPDHLVVQFLV